MKKVISLMLAATMTLGICACGSTGGTSTTTAATTTGSGTTANTVETTQNPFIVPVTDDFNADDIVLQFAAVSDVHIASGHAVNPQGRVKSALEQLKEAALVYTDKGLDAVIVAGDLTDDYGSDQNLKANEITALKNVYESVFNPADVPMIYGLGNHDHDFERNGGAGSTLQQFINVMGNKEAHTQYDVECSDSAHGSRHAVIGKYHFLFVEPITYGCTGADDTGAKFYAETKTWLDNELKAITEANPDQYVFVITHPMLYGTVYGSDLLTSGIYWYTKDLNDLLSKYPQVVTFGGHLHFPLNDERSIMQTAFTALGCGSVQYMAIEDGAYDDMASATTMKDKGSVSSGYLVQVDGAGNVRFIRMDFQNRATIKDPFVIKAPTADKSHLEKYSKNRGNSTNNDAPVLAPNAITVSDNSNTQDEILSTTINFAAATDDDLVHHYLLTVSEGGKVIETHKILTDYYRCAQVAKMKTEYTVKLTTKFARGGKYEIKLVAYDCWDAVSNELVYKYEPVLDVSSVVLPDTYADIDFANGTATDKNGKINIELIGATVADGSYTFNGVTKTLTGINMVGGNQYAKLTFANCANADDMDTLIKNGFTVELLYVNRSNSGTQNIFSGCGAKGFGIYEQDGVPAVKVFTVKDFKETVHKEAASTENLVHVLATYARTSGVLAVYVNGEMSRSTATGYPKTIGNVYALGANVSAANGTIEGGASDLSIVDVKFYAEKFSQAQAFVRYQNVLAEYGAN